MFRYVVSYWDAGDDMVGLDVMLCDVLIDVLQPNQLALEIPAGTVNALISCQVDDTQEIVFLAGYSVEVNHGEN